MYVHEIFFSGFDGSTTGDGNITGGGEGGAVGDAQGRFTTSCCSDSLLKPHFNELS